MEWDFDERSRRFMRIAVAADHAGYECKDRIGEMLRAGGHEVVDYGTHDGTPVDYPQYGYVVGEAVASGQAQRGIVVCGSSLGIAIAANKVPGVRACPAGEPLSAELGRRHNDCNVLAISARLSGWEMIERIVEVFLKTPFEQGRHAHRVQQLFEFGDAQRVRTLKAIEAGDVADAQTPNDLPSKS
jgi:ribose 5-phosphate isomerase B